MMMKKMNKKMTNKKTKMMKMMNKSLNNQKVLLSQFHQFNKLINNKEKTKQKLNNETNL